jgi:hypothetical protein
MSEKTQEAAASAPPPAERKPALFEALALLLLSLATVGTAWCSYEAAGWGGTAGGLANQSEAATRRAVVDRLQASQMALMDVTLFSQHINARASSNEPLARFYSDRFRGEAKSAFDAWMATHPFENANAPAHPFVTNLYHPQLLEDAGRADVESQQFYKKAGEAGRTSRRYVLITVMLACALFCGGTASKFEHVTIRRSVLALGLLAFSVAALNLLELPVMF